MGFNRAPHDENDADDHFDNLAVVPGAAVPVSEETPPSPPSSSDGDSDSQLDFEVLLMRKFWGRWVRKVGIKTGVCDPLREAECAVDWTRVIAPVLEGRIKIIGS